MTGFIIKPSVQLVGINETSGKIVVWEKGLALGYSNEDKTAYGFLSLKGDEAFSYHTFAPQDTVSFTMAIPIESDKLWLNVSKAYVGSVADASVGSWILNDDASGILGHSAKDKRAHSIITLNGRRLAIPDAPAFIVSEWSLAVYHDDREVLQLGYGK